MPQILYIIITLQNWLVLGLWKNMQIHREMTHISHRGNKSSSRRIHLIEFDYWTKYNYFRTAIRLWWRCTLEESSTCHVCLVTRSREWSQTMATWRMAHLSLPGSLPISNHLCKVNKMKGSSLMYSSTQLRPSTSISIFWDFNSQIRPLISLQRHVICLRIY